jgi:hypothetical protein
MKNQSRNMLLKWTVHYISITVNFWCQNFCTMYLILQGTQRNAEYQIRNQNIRMHFCYNITVHTHKHTHMQMNAGVYGCCVGILTLSLLTSYIYGAPCKARNFNVVYIWTYVWQRWKPYLSVCCTMFQHWINTEGFPVSQLCVNTLPATKITLITNGI